MEGLIVRVEYKIDENYDVIIDRGAVAIYYQGEFISGTRSSTALAFAYQVKQQEVEYLEKEIKFRQKLNYGLNTTIAVAVHKLEGADYAGAIKALKEGTYNG